MSSPVGPDEPTAGTGRPDPAVIAHRGFAGVYPENTLAAVRAASSGGAPGGGRPETIEIDVMPSADGEIVVFHDSTLDRVATVPADRQGRYVWDLPYAALGDVDVLGTGEPVPRLEEVLATVPADVRVNVELKNPGTSAVRFAENLRVDERAAARDRWLDFTERVVGVLDGTPHELLFSSFYEGALAAAREVAPDVPLAWIFRESIADGFAVARRYDCEAVHPPWNMLVGSSLFNAEYVGTEPFEEIDLVAVARSEGREVNAWTVETWHQAAEMRRVGVDGMLTDYPGLLQYGEAGGSAVGNS